MQATFTKSAFSDIKESAIKASRNQALIHQYSVIAETKMGIDEIVIARLYAPLRRGAIKTTCILYTYGKHGVFASGYAQGIGHQKSAALADAIRNAGVNLSESVAYRDGEPVREALLAIARADCPDAKILGVFEAHN